MHKPVITALVILSTISFSMPAQEAPENTEQEISAEQMFDEETTSEEPAGEEVEIEETETEPTITETPAEVAEPKETAPPATEPTPQEPIAQEEKTVIPQEPATPEELTGIDTVSLENPQGNWLFKKIWWERAEERYEKIRTLVDSIWEFRTKFFVARNELDRKVLDPFYINIGIDRGELQIMLSEINDFLEKQRDQQEPLSEEETILYELHAAEEETLKQLQRDIEAINSLDHAIDDALGKLMDQINRVRNYETQAWNNFREIAHILNDTKARELYYMIEGAARNIKDISTYLERDFFTHFNKLISETAQHITRVQNQMEALKEKGISFKRQTDLLEQKQQIAQAEQEDEEEEVVQKPKLGWFAWIGSLFSKTLGTIWSVIRLPYDMIFGK